MKTRERILHTSLALFNELGEPNVTTLLIADEMEISPGNLYYHFKSKSDILSELFDWYERDMTPLLEVPETAMDIEDQWFFLHLIFETIEKYRFLYKDLINVLGKYERLNSRFQRIISRKREASLTILNNLREQGFIQASQEEIGALSENIVLTATFWLDYALVAMPKADQNALARGVYQVISLVAPYLEKEQREQLNALKQAYA
ncbi:MAG: TetR/AcrR family transcriptional regulator [Oleiphilaceae bacterium]|nr:TetR/AcrR family transcriptional regulator [Oleiphilaceae bacterium]